MKKIFTILLALATCVRMSIAETVKVGELFYSLDLNEKTAEVTYRSCVNDIYNANWHIESVSIPSTITYDGIVYNVSSIGANAFCECSNLLSVKMQSGIKTIGTSAFYGCAKLREINIPYGVYYISPGAFYGCNNLENVNLPNSVRAIGKHAFSGCKKLSTISIPEGISSIENGTFKECTGLKSVNIPSSVAYIGDYAFAGCSSMITVALPNTIKHIGGYAFTSCSSLKELHGPSRVDYVKAGISSSTRVIHCDKSSSEASNQHQSMQNSFQPPMLVLEEKSLLFEDATNNNRLDANEQCSIKFWIRNNGKGVARNCEVRVRMSGSTKGVTCRNVSLPAITPGQLYETAVPVSSSIDTQKGTIKFTIEVYEPNGWGIAPFDITVATKAYDPPLLQVVDYKVASNSGKIRKMEPFTLTFNLQNTKYGDAEDVKVKISLPSNVYVMDGNAELSYPLIKSGEVKPIQLVLAANNNYSTQNIPITISIKEKYGKFAENKQLDIALNQTTSSSINIAAKDEPQLERKEIQLALLKSGVDLNIPISNATNPNTFAVIIANENYEQVAKVPYAINDGNIFKQYCEKTLGIPATNIHFVSDATINNIRQQVNWLSQVSNVYEGQASIIFYYAGHGVPDEQSKTAFLLPKDGNGMDITTGYKLDDLYKKLGQLPAKSVTIFLDACFSGSKREDGMLTSARGVAIKVKSGQPVGKMVVFTAATGDETAYPNNKEGHGMFTYYLLKKLQETSGNVTYEELGDYIRQNVSRQSVVLNGKLQTPTVIPSADATDWQNWTLK